MNGLRCGPLVFARWSSRLAQRALIYNSYYPAFDRGDFQQLGVLGPFGSLEGPAAPPARLWRVRDPRYFQFRDKYVLLFDNARVRDEYLERTRGKRLNKVRVRFQPAGELATVVDKFMQYSRNLEAAYASEDAYRLAIASPNEESTKTLGEAVVGTELLESKSALVWNLPNTWHPGRVADTFWQYDVKHCFKMFWNELDNVSLYYFAFNETHERDKFKYNVHGVYLNEAKLLVESL
ncbi:Pet54p KNAG_0A01630 [Huiozyma naganishii CBS 8797]|uniref:Uncharacterized protein n=1 Tax=Huiozyma naganishii (strain ATCC MYA-139 / BCRC 22969 / CBS 8797 / KCTC 17520 / NBRC 10181 / NCYC 3082 / Yp74L-3) TaxID=1071383 RepID=J7RT23_HUIN7|nr:hypothetical protein KNAG_0A01630 [Kazachstania naganishii CBS 8797]CCK67852.1 hypothetical protein KNAG_0A01630 [Kazachstania naganishii CBS 8797]